MKNEKLNQPAEIKNNTTDVESVSSTSGEAKKVERVVIGDAAISRINHWIKQVEASRPGVEISRRDLIEWLILGHSEDLLPSEVKQLSESHYNELRFLQYAIRELKAAQRRGESVALQDVIGALPSNFRAKERSSPRSKRLRPDLAALPSVEPLAPGAEESATIATREQGMDKSEDGF